jgi:hypothetical protein
LARPVIPARRSFLVEAYLAVLLAGLRPGQ